MLANLPAQRARSQEDEDLLSIFSDQSFSDPSETQKPNPIEAPLTPPTPNVNEEGLQHINPYLMDNLATGKWLAFDINKGAKQIDIVDNNDEKSNSNISDKARMTSPIVFKKKLVQPRFSRRRYLREYNGLRLLPALINTTGFITVLIMALVINLGILIPKTASNNQIAVSQQDLIHTIQTLKPQLQGLSAQHLALKSALAEIKVKIPLEETIRQQLDHMLSDLNANRAIRLIHHDVTLVTIAEDEIPFLALSLKLETGFITWMEQREALFQSLVGVKVQKETLTAPPRQSTIIVETLIHIPVLTS